MSLLRAALLLFTASVLASCSAGNQNEPTSVEQSNDDMKTGYMLMGDELVEVEYYLDGEFAVLDAHSRVPASAIVPDYQSLSLSSLSGVKLWPQGIVPYKFSIVNTGIDRAYFVRAMSITVEQFARAGIRLVPHTQEPHFLDIRIVNPDSPECKEIGCESFYGVANFLGFASPGQGFLTKQTHSGNIVWIPESKDYPFFREAKPPKHPTGWKKGGVHLLLHEIGHALGALHEQAHPEAREYLRKNPGMRGRFESYPTTQAFTSFDYRSVMLYCDSFIRKNSKSDNPICETHDWPTELSPKDVDGLRKLYASQVASSTEKTAAQSAPPAAAAPAAAAPAAAKKSTGPVKPPTRKVGGDERRSASQPSGKKENNGDDKKVNGNKRNDGRDVKRK